MKKIIIITAIYILCGFYAFGTSMAELNYRNHCDWLILHRTSRDNVGLCAAEAMLGPMGAIAMALMTNFNQHGWELWEKP